MPLRTSTRHRFRCSAAIWLLALPFVLAACSTIPVERPRPTVPAQTDADFPTEPLLRLDPEGHVAAINGIDLDAQGRWLVSGAHDKTIKVWRLADGALERTLRVPQGPGDLGKVYAVAISPDGAQVAAGGWTGGNVSGQQTIYIFDRATGALQHRIGGLLNVIHHLAYAPDGKRLVATLGEGGMRLYRTDDYEEIARDADYGNQSYWADFAADGRLVTSSLDGKLRLYGPDGRLEKSAKAPGGEYPIGVAFAPDGTRIAAGYADNTRVDILDARTLKRIYAADTAGVDNGNLGSVAWSADGRRLLVGGGYDVDGWRSIRRWAEGGRGPYEELRVATQTVMALRPLADGRLAVGAGDKVALLDARDQSVWERPNATADFRGQLHGQGLRLSATGDTVAFGYEQWGKRPARFSLGELTLTLDPKDLADLRLPDEGPREGLAVTDWVNSYAPKLNSRLVALKEFETARALAIAPDGERFVLGAEWSLYAFDRSGTQLWRQAVPGVVYAVNITGNGRYAVAGHGDGTLRWHRMSDGQWVLALYPHPDGKRWVLWTPEGYYQASAGGEDLIGWHLNRGAEEAPDFFPVSRFRERFYRPDVIARVLETGDPAAALRLADAARGQQTDTPSVAEVLPPTIEILSPAAGTPVDSRRLALFYHARSQTAPIDRVEVRVDGRPAKVLAQALPATARGSNEWLAQLTLEIPPRNVTVELIAYNKHGASEAARFYASWTGGTDYYKPDLWVLAVGISDHPVRKARLKWAAQDATDLVAALEAQKGGLYKKVHYRLLTDQQATREAIRRGLFWLRRQTDARDVAILFLSGHGFRDAFGDYYYLPYDGRPEEAELSSVNGDDFRRFLRTVSGKTVLFIDTCYSGGLRTGKGVTDSLPDMARFANELADAESGVVVFASSTGKQLSQEKDQWRNGAFTEALLEGLGGKADYTGDFFLFIWELETYLTDRVSELTDHQQKPVTTKPKAVENYRLLRVAHH
jgi:WD40 repeat protein